MSAWRYAWGSKTVKTARKTESILQQVRREKRRVQRSSLIFFPLGTMLIALILALIFFIGLGPKSQVDDDQGIVLTPFYGFFTWISSLPRIFGHDFQPGSLLFAVAAVSIAIFLALSTSTPPPENQDTVISRANRMVLDDFSVLVATVCAVMAWLTLITIDLGNPQRLPDIVAVVATAWLCSATVPLHLVRADVHRFTLLEAQKHHRVFGLQQAEFNAASSSLAHFSRRRELLSYILWIVLGAGAATLVFVGYTLAGEDTVTGVTVLLYMMVFIVMAGWGWFTNELLMECSLDWKQRQRIFSIFCAVLYLFCAFMCSVLVYILLYRSWNSWFAAVTAVIVIITPVCAALLDRSVKCLGLLTGIKVRRTRTRILRFERTMEFAKRQLAINTAGAARRKTRRRRYS